MSYQPSFSHPTTPPYEHVTYLRDHRRNVSNASMYTDDSSPETIQGALPTPVKSPIRQQGPMLLPRIRSQDQTVEPPAPVKGHRKALSDMGGHYNPPTIKAPSRRSRPTTVRRSASPAGVAACDLLSPVSVAPSAGSCLSSTLNSPIHMTPCPPRPSHSRSVSASSVNDQVLEKYGFPTYRQMPTYIPPTTYAPTATYTVAHAGASTFVPPPTSLPRSYTLPSDLQYEGSDSTTTLFDYLTGPNPTPALVRQLKLNAAGRGSGQTYFWWDIRNLQSWPDFNLSAIDRVPGLMQLLKVELPSAALPDIAIARSKLQPDTESALQDLCHDFYARKVTNSLKVAQGPPHMMMRLADTKTQFLSNYQDESIIYGGARVVGLVKSFDRWNTGMRSEAPHRKVEYLLGLAHLHKSMRDHACRYGFLMTEIELICVRAGTDETPHFGHLQISSPIAINATSGLTAALALWYLHMLGKKDPLPHQPGAKIDVGGAAALTRQKVLSAGRDRWIPAPQLGEKREAKRNRGWVWPEDPLHRRELPKVGRRGYHKS
ncbi:MAG: hypothetical protein M1817_000025 [Caeruleum heppii]|nr:MAG: hypothetical protein M1817_000025 [Caeruleum heppii]